MKKELSAAQADLWRLKGVLNELAEGARSQTLSRDLLGLTTRLLARPYEAGEKVVIKPSNVAFKAVAMPRAT